MIDVANNYDDFLHAALWYYLTSWSVSKNEKEERSNSVWEKVLIEKTFYWIIQNDEREYIQGRILSFLFYVSFVVKDFFKYSSVTVSDLLSRLQIDIRVW